MSEKRKRLVCFITLGALLLLFSIVAVYFYIDNALRKSVRAIASKTVTGVTLRVENPVDSRYRTMTISDSKILSRLQRIISQADPDPFLSHFLIYKGNLTFHFSDGTILTIAIYSEGYIGMADSPHFKLSRDDYAFLDDLLSKTLAEGNIESSN